MRRSMKPDSMASWRAAQELPDHEEDTIKEITEWSNCDKHGKYPTEATEVFGYDPKHPGREGMRICPLCYADIMTNTDKENEK